MDISAFDEQLIDLVVGWSFHRQSGYSVHSCLSAAARRLPEPSLTEWRKLDDEFLSTLDLDAALQHMAEQIPSDALKLVVDAFHQNWIKGGGNELDERIKSALELLWENFGPQPKPSVTNFDATLGLLRQFTFAFEPTTRLTARRQLLELGDHLITYLFYALDFGFLHTPIALFELFWALGTDKAVKQLQHFHETGTNEYYSALACQVLVKHRIRLTAAPMLISGVDLTYKFSLYLRVDLEPEAVLQTALNMIGETLAPDEAEDDSEVPDQPPQFARELYAGLVYDSFKSFYEDNLHFSPTKELFLAIPYGDDGAVFFDKIFRMTLALLKETDWEMMMVFDDLILRPIKSLIFWRKPGALFLNLGSGFWIPENLQSVTIPYKKIISLAELETPNSE